MEELSKNNQNNNASSHIVDFLLDATLKKHGVTLDKTKVSETDKETLRDMVSKLRKDVDGVMKSNNEEDETK